MVGVSFLILWVKLVLLHWLIIVIVGVRSLVCVGILYRNVYIFGYDLKLVLFFIEKVPICR